MVCEWHSPLMHCIELDSIFMLNAVIIPSFYISMCYARFMILALCFSFQKCYSTRIKKSRTNIAEDHIVRTKH